MDTHSTSHSHGDGCRITNNKRGQASMHTHFSSLTFATGGLAKASQVAEPRLRGWRNSLPFGGRSGKVAKGVCHTGICGQIGNHY